MELSANAKINLTLDILRKREDGYHDLQMVMQSVTLADRLTVTPARGAAVYDLIYHPAETELLRKARRRGLCAEGGLSMLVWQAVLALEHFLDRPLDREELARAAAAALLED